MGESERGEWITFHDEDEDNEGSVAAAEKPAKASGSPRTAQTQPAPARVVSTLLPAPSPVPQHQAWTPPAPRTALGDNTLLLEAINNEGGFIEGWVKDRSALSDAPQVFHAFTAFALLSTAAGNRYEWPARGKTNYPNQFYVLIGPSGIRKSTAVNQGGDLLEEVIPDSILPSSFSRESFDDALEHNPAGILIFSEFSEFLRKAKTKDYLAGIIDIMTDLYDNPGRRKINFRRRSFTIKKPAPSILAATTPDRLEEVIDRSLLIGGFIPRFLVAVAMEPGPKVPLNVTTTWSTGTLAQALKDIAANKGQVNFSAVPLLIDSFEQRYMADLNARGRNSDLDGMYNRVETQVMRIATLFMLSRTHGTNLIVTDEDVLRASKVIDYSHGQMEAIPFAFTPTARALRCLEDMIKAKPGITRRVVLQDTKWRVDYLKPLFETLAARGYRQTTGKAGGQEQVRYWPQ